MSCYNKKTLTDKIGVAISTPRRDSKDPLRGRFAMCPRISGWFLSVLAAITLSVLISFPVDAQVVGANLSGTAKDASGAALPNATVSIRNAGTGVIREVTTDTAGFYVMPNLLPGNYEITTSAAGFETQVQKGITLTVGAQQVLNITMQVGQMTSKVEVTADAPTVELASSSVGALVDSTTVRELPLNGRSWTDLATLQPGVSGVETQANMVSGSTRGTRGFGAQITVSGGRPQWNNYRLDGTSINDFANGGPGSVLGGNLGVDAIQEFSMITSNYSAEYGRTAGGVVNAITRSGTNQFHGAVYEFLRNSALDARNFFDPATIPPFRRNQFGADGGAPILKDKLFIFGDYEGVRQSKSVTSLQTVPSVAAASGHLCSAPSSPGACTPTTVTVDPSVQKYLPFFPLPNGGLVAGSNGDIGIWNVPAPQVVGENFFTARGDYKISDKDSLAAVYLRDDATFTTPTVLNATLLGDITNRQVGTLEETHTFSPNWLNTARLGYSRGETTNSRSIAAINPLASDSSLGAIPGQTAAALTVSGLTGFKGGVGSAPSTIYIWNSVQGYDDAFWTHGTHSFKFGGAVERIEENPLVLSQGGAFTFSSLQNFLTNVPSKYAISTTAVTAEYGIRQSVFGLYAQDDWRARPNLTLNLGLRWEMTTVPTEVHNHLSALINLTDATTHLGSPYYSNNTLRNFDPRVGFAWDPFKNGKTAVRGGFGIFDVLPLPYEYTQKAISSAPFSVASAVNALPKGAFYAGAASLLTSSSQQVSYIEQNPHRSYVMQYNLNVQRELPGQVTASLGYVGMRGVHLPFRSDDVDAVIPTLTSAGYLYPAPPLGKNPGTGASRLNSNFGAIYGMFYDNNSDYNALQARVQKSLSHGLQIQGSFTWGKGFDDGSSTAQGDSFTNSVATLPIWFNLGTMRGLSDFNITRKLVIDGIWIVPSPKSLPKPAEWVTSGWELGVIYTANDGVPFTPTFGSNGDPLGQLNSAPIDFPSLVGGPGCQSLINPGNVTNYLKTQCFQVPQAPSQAFYTANCNPNFAYPQCFNLLGNSGRNIVIGPGLSNLDLSVYKDNHITERLNIQFRAEIFNILNRANFNFPVTAGNSVNTNVINANGTVNPTAGLIGATTTDSRQIQFGLKVAW
jgi:outer membrane receptor protein involved in Fe transport